jgi:polysaccharide export outer membrane protein
VSGRTIVLPEIGEIPLSGVLRSELTEHLRTEMARYVRDPVVESRSLIRLEILGAVGTQGFYTLPSDLLLSDAIMIAGGPANNAAIEKVTVERAGRLIWDEQPLRAAVIEGRTLDQLSLRAGDSILVPEERSVWEKVRSGMVVLTALSSLFLIGSRTGIF